MQKSRRWRGLEFLLLSLVGTACTPAAKAPAATPPSTSSGTDTHEPNPTENSADAGRAEPTARDEASAETLPKGTRVLQIGDSFADALGGNLGKMLRAAEVKSNLEFETPSYIPNWSYGAKLRNLIANYQPDLVLITLGANEIEIPHPDERVKPIKHLVSVLGGRPCVWIAPPLWKPDTGLLKVLSENVAPCRYLDSNLYVHDLPRAHDKIHPSLEGREIWAKMVFDWLIKERVGTPEQPWALKPGEASR